MTADLTPEELGAREFWRQAATGSIPVHYFVDEFNRLQDTYSDLESASLEVELNQLVGDLGYGTDLDTISAAMAGGMATDLGHWTGTYGLVDEQDARYTLDVDEDGATLTLPSSTVDTETTVRSVADYRSKVTLSGSAFTDGRLTLSNADCSATVTFSYAVELADLARTDRDPPEIAGRTQPRCRGELRIGDSARTVALTGKRGCYTAEGIRRTEDGDPAGAWAGVYHVMDISEPGAWVWLPEPLVLRKQDDGLSVQWGDRSGSNVRFVQNHLLADLANPKAQLALRFEMVDGTRKRCAGVCRAGGTEQVLHGYWLHPEPQATARRTATTIRPMAALETAVQAEPELVLDVASSNRRIDPPIGVPGHPYELKVRLVNADKLGPKPYAWAVTGFDKVGIEPDADSTVASLTGQFAVGDAGTKKITLTVTAGAGESTAYTGTFQVAVLTMVVTPATLPPVVRRMDYRVGFEVNGGIGPYTWTESKDSALPSGLRFDPGKHELVGKVGTAESQDVYTLRLEVRPADHVKMTPLKVSVPFSVNEPVQIGGEAMGYFQFVLGGLGSMFLLLNGVRTIVDWRKSARRDAGDPSIHRGYQWADRTGRAITAGIEGAVGKNYATYIERAVRFDTEHRVRGLVDSNGKRMASALGLYDDLITRYNARIKDATAALERARLGTDKNRIKTLEVQLEGAKGELRERLEKVNDIVTRQKEDAERERRDARDRPIHERIASRIRGGK